MCTGTIGSSSTKSLDLGGSMDVLAPDVVLGPPRLCSSSTRITAAELVVQQTEPQGMAILGRFRFLRGPLVPSALPSLFSGREFSDPLIILLLVSCIWIWLFLEGDDFYHA